MKNLLIADDSGFTREILGRMLNQTEYTIIFAANGTEALKKISENDICLAVVDLLMPDKDGFEILETLKKMNSTLPVIILSADIQESTKTRCTELGARAFLNKPVKKEVLTESINSIIGAAPC